MSMESIKETEDFLFLLKLLKKAFKFLNADFAIMAFLSSFYINLNLRLMFNITSEWSGHQADLEIGLMLSVCL